MSLSDEEFRELYKPIHVPAHYDAKGTDREKVLYALGQIGEGTAEHVANFLSDIDTSIAVETFTQIASAVLKELFDHGRIKGRLISNEMHYDLSKITQSNDGEVNPGLLAPGLNQRSYIN